MAPRCRRAAAAAVAAALTLTATGCIGSAADQVNFAVDGLLTTYNANTVNGAASAGPQAFARALTGFGFHGPDGQVLADNDFGAVTVVGRPGRVPLGRIAAGLRTWLEAVAPGAVDAANHR